MKQKNQFATVSRSKNKRVPAMALSLSLALLGTGVHARNITSTDLLNLLVDNDVVSKEQAKEMVATIQDLPESESGLNDDENAQVDNHELLQLLVDQGLVSEEQAHALRERVIKRERHAQKHKETEVASDEVRVPYIPKYMQQEMQERLKFAVESDVIDGVREEVVRTARVQGWGIKEAPSWVHSIKLSGDGRVRYQGDFFSSDNSLYARTNITGVNENGISDPRKTYDNVTDDRHRLRSRFRLKVTAKPTETIKLGMRFTTGNQGNPVSSNQTLGNFGRKWETSMDLGYVHYRAMDKDIELWGGRFSSPMLKTDLIFDNDMTFEGLAGSYYFNRDDSMYDDFSQWDSYLTLGVFPIEELHQFVDSAATDSGLSFENGDDKMLYALQLGTSYEFSDSDILSLALSWYHYDNITGKANARENNDLQNATASGFYQSGNTLFNIANDPNGNEQFFALASEFSLANLTFKYRMANFYPVYVDFHADFVKNIAFDKAEIEDRIGSIVKIIDGNPVVVPAEVASRDIGYQLGASLGTFTIKNRYDWRLGMTYRHLEGDAVLDAFADSDFLLGGTDARGYMLYGQYGLLDNVIAGFKFISADSIDTDADADNFNLSVDTLFMDISARF